MTRKQKQAKVFVPVLMARMDGEWHRMHNRWKRPPMDMLKEYLEQSDVLALSLDQEAAQSIPRVLNSSVCRIPEATSRRIETALRRSTAKFQEEP